jgi:hypothetical protein
VDAFWCFFEDRSSRFFTRLADMINVLLSRRWGSPRIGRGAIWCLSLALLPFAPSATLAQTSTSKARSPEAGTKDSAKAKAAARAGADDAPAPAPDIPAAPVADPAQSRKVEPIEVFKDPNVELLQLLDLNKFKALPPIPFTETDRLTVLEMAGNKNSNVDPSVIDRVVRGLAAKLTDKAGIQALITIPEEPAPPAADASPAALKKAQAAAQAAAQARSDAARAIPDATAKLLEPMFSARFAGNLEFLKVYQRSLKQSLPPLLSLHLIPRVQAMIILGESGDIDLIELFENQIANPKQTLWVKLWAIEGIKKSKEYGGRLPSDQEAKAAKFITDFLDKTESLPWPIQLRGLEALASLRQGYLPTAPKQAHMASTAMRFLADPDARLEVRAEAARALGLMQITTTAVPKFNYSLVAHGAGQLAAELGTRINALYPDTKTLDNPTKAKYLTALLVGPVYQAFDGISTQRDSGGLIRTSSSSDHVLNVFNRVKPVAQSAVDLLGAPPKQYKDRKKTLATQIAALRTFLEKNPPTSRQLVPGGEDFMAAAGGDAPEGNGIAEPAKRVRRGRAQ